MFRYLLRHKRSICIITVVLVWVFYLFWHISRLNFNVIVYNNQKIREIQVLNSTINKSEPRKKLTIVVPFRDRFDELIVFVPHLSDFLKKQNIDTYYIFVINQSRRYRFNRGALANVGYLLARNHCDYIAIHDVDLIPLNMNLSYSYPSNGPYHVSSPKYHPQYNYSKYFGGILLISNAHFERVNGMSNRYFGWGLEDDEFYTRVKAANLSISRPDNLTTDSTNTFLHIHHDRQRDTFRTREQRQQLKKRDKLTGLNNIRYSVTDQHNLTIDSRYKCSIFNVELYCDTRQTPWCLNSLSRSDT